MSNDTSPAQPDGQGTPTAELAQPEGKAGHEAAKYRTRLREAEAERDSLRDQLTAMRRATIDSRVKAQRITPEGFWASGVELDDLLDADGNLDDEKVTTAIDTAVDTLGLAREPVGPYVPREGGSPKPPKIGGWEAAFAPQ